MIKNGLDGMCHLGVGQLIVVKKIQFSVRNGRVEFKVLNPQNVFMRKRCVFSVLFRNLRFTIQEQLMGVTYFSRT